jgi:hypothetical protein
MGALVVEVLMLLSLHRGDHALLRSAWKVSGIRSFCQAS